MRKPSPLYTDLCNTATTNPPDTSINIFERFAYDHRGTIEAIDFLEQLRPRGPWVLTAIIPDGSTETITATTADEIDAFVREHNGQRNLYFSVNLTRKRMTSKAKKSDIAAIEYIPADLDPQDDETPQAAKARYLDAIAAYPIPCTAILDSGNGIQALWQLAVPDSAALIADVEARTKALMEALGAKAGTQNIDRILRLPGTTNLPNAKKKNDGRVACLTKLLRFNGVTCNLENFPPAASTSTPPPQQERDAAADDFVFLETSLPADLLDLICNGVEVGKRSEQFHHVVKRLKELGWPEAEIETLLGRYPSGISKKYPGRVAEEVHRSFNKPEQVLADPIISKLNERFALVIIGDTTAVLKTSNNEISFLKVPAFEQWHVNRHVQYNDKKVPLGKYWITHPQRRQYEGITFSPLHDKPGHFNLWRGFSVEPKQGDCSKLLKHIEDNVCCGNQDHYRWVIGWFADIVQHPDHKIGTSLVLRGEQGTGKTKVGQVFGSLFRQHYVPVSDPRYITGRFNSHLVSCLLLHADEGFWAGDHAAEGKLKDLITGEYQLIEFKQKEAIKVRNYVRLLVTGNSEWLVPAGFGERRFATFDMGRKHEKDTDYFAAIDHEMNNGGREALLHHLLSVDLTKVNLRIIPKTAALLEQQVSSLTPEQSWWLDTLTRGELPRGCDEEGQCPSERLFDRYIARAIRQGARRRSIEVQIGAFLRKYVSDLRRVKATYRRWDGLKNVDFYGWTYTFPPLGECREAFIKKLGHTIDWGEDAEWTTEPMPEEGEVPF
jgi:hypothetical protein